jgi:hypothetical protein
LVGSGEQNNVTAIRARAMQRGQCSTLSQGGLGVIVNPHRGQIKCDGSAFLARDGRAETAALTSRLASDVCLVGSS